MLGPNSSARLVAAWMPVARVARAALPQLLLELGAGRQQEGAEEEAEEAAGTLLVDGLVEAAVEGGGEGGPEACRRASRRLLHLPICDRSRQHARCSPATVIMPQERSRAGVFSCRPGCECVAKDEGKEPGTPAA